MGADEAAGWGLRNDVGHGWPLVSKFWKLKFLCFCFFVLCLEKEKNGGDGW